MSVLIQSPGVRGFTRHFFRLCHRASVTRVNRAGYVAQSVRILKVLQPGLYTEDHVRSVSSSPLSVSRGWLVGLLVGWVARWVGG